ncbi:MAG: apolipoprotein N-acyltransferase [Candidatus Omnitrophica bacterium]|nr:apolipoprotein N-acyltransferase [Candidatus Omnitrophota bacterium]
MTKVTIVGWLVLGLYLSLYPAFFGLLTSFCLKSFINENRKLYLLFILPCIWVGFEFVRSHLLTGFGWNSLGYSQFRNLALIQIADSSGVYGVSFVVMFANCIFWMVTEEVIARKQGIYKKIIGLLLSLAFVLVSVLGYGLLRLAENFSKKQDILRVSIVQPNISQNLKWNPYAKDYILEEIIDLSIEAAKDAPDMIIWPESALPIYFELDSGIFDVVSGLAKDLNTHLLTGAVRVEQDEFYNSAILISPQGSLLTLYDKLHLVPYGEFIPFRRLTPFLASIVGIGDFSWGKSYTIFNLKDIRFAVLICFEDAFSNLSRQFLKEGASILVNITNDAWFDRQAEPQQHLSQSVFRAVENRVSIVRCANTGISGLINAKGKMEKFVSEETFVRGFKTFPVAVKLDYQTYYNRHGDLFVLICIILAMLAITKSIYTKIKAKA